MRFMNYFSDGRSALIPLNSTRFLECCAELLIAQLLLEQALLCRTKLAGAEAGSADAKFYAGKMETAKFFCRNTLTRVFGRHAALEQEDTSAVDIDEEAFNF